MNPEERMLSSRLKADAPEPGFSEALHERIVAGLHAIPRTPRRWAWFIAAPFGAAAVVALVVGAWSRPHAQPVRSLARVSIPDVSPAALLPHPALPSDAEVQSAQFAYLDRDARELGKFVLEELAAGR